MRRHAALTPLWIVFLVFAAGLGAAAQTTLLARGSVWRYLDNGSDQGTAWQAVGFNDTGWASGPAQLGYGDGDEATLVGFGPDPNNKYVTTYFRRAFYVANPAAFADLTVNVLRDDGAVVYLNGTEVFRTNMPAGPIAFTTLSPVPVSGVDETTTFFPGAVSPALLVSGTNVLAVEIHQNAGNSSDISFDLELTSTSLAVTRGPYLQQGSPTSVTVRWRTGVATNSRVRLGAAPGSLGTIVDDATSTTEHIVTVSGLSANTTYYYSVGTTAGPLAGDDATHFFVTPPTAGTAKSTRAWVLGDCGTAGPTGSYADQTAVKNAYYAYTGARHTDLWLMLGDNAYMDGTDTEYQNAVFAMYPDMLRKSVLWPCIGNHETSQSQATSTAYPYYQIFTLPTAAQAGGVASGTESYYAFDYGNIHFIVLDSMTSAYRAPGSPMTTWLTNDLAANTRTWIVAFWHHPPYTKGSHDSDTEAELIEMRTNILPILENGGVDLVLTGHSHSYERSFLIDQHYGASGTFTNGMKKDGGDGRPGGNGAYRKPTAGPAAHEGAVYAVAGSSGWLGGGSLNHPAMFISLNRLGSMVLDVNGAQLDAVFLGSTGLVEDSFTIIKGNKTVTVTAPNGGESYAVGASVPVTWTSAGGVGNVAIDLSIDGGTTYPYALAASTPNDGAQTVALPAGVASTRARIRVSEAGNGAVNDVGNADFVISGPTNVVALVAGYNGVALPLTPATAYTAETLAQSVNGQGGTCTSVLQYANGSFVTHPVGSAVNNFAIVVGKGYFLRCTAPSTWTVAGAAFTAVNAPIALSPGYNLIGLPLDPLTAYTAERVCTEANGQGGSVTQVLKYENGTYVTHPVGSALNNFTLGTGRAYFLRSGGTSTWTVTR